MHIFRQLQCTYMYVRQFYTVDVDISGYAVIYCMYTATTLYPYLVIKNKCTDYIYIRILGYQILKLYTY